MTLRPLLLLSGFLVAVGGTPLTAQSGAVLKNVYGDAFMVGTSVLLDAPRPRLVRSMVEHFVPTVPFASYLPRPVVGSEGLSAAAWDWTWERHGAPQEAQRGRVAMQRGQ